MLVDGRAGGIYCQNGGDRNSRRLLRGRMEWSRDRTARGAKKFGDGDCGMCAAFHFHSSADSGSTLALLLLAFAALFGLSRFRSRRLS